MIYLWQSTLAMATVNIKNTCIKGDGYNNHKEQCLQQWKMAIVDHQWWQWWQQPSKAQHCRRWHAYNNEKNCKSNLWQWQQQVVKCTANRLMVICTSKHWFKHKWTPLKARTKWQQQAAHLLMQAWQQQQLQQCITDCWWKQLKQQDTLITTDAL